MSDGKTIVFFPEAAFGPALNSVGIAQVCRDMGHRPVFLCDPGFAGVFEGYGFEEHSVAMSEPMEPEAMARYWSDFINGQIPNFRTPPIEQVSTYIKACWEAIVETSFWAEKSLPGVLEGVRPDLICVDNVVLFPAAKRYGVPWVRIISCSENEIEDPDIPPHLSGCHEDDTEGFARYRKKFELEIGPIHAKFNEFLVECGEEPYPLGLFFEASPWLNLLHYPRPLAFNRRHPLDEEKFVYLEGCIRDEEPFEIPRFTSHNDKPLIYVSFGSLGSGDTDLMKRLMTALGTMPYRVLVNVGDYAQAYDQVPDNCHVQSWYPQRSHDTIHEGSLPSVVPDPVRICRPKHPLDGEIVTVIGLRNAGHRGQKAKLRLPDGSICWLPLSWTSLGACDAASPRLGGTLSDFVALRNLLSIFDERCGGGDAGGSGAASSGSAGVGGTLAPLAQCAGTGPGAAGSGTGPGDDPDGGWGEDR